MTPAGSILPWKVADSQVSGISKWTSLGAILAQVGTWVSRAVQSHAVEQNPTLSTSESPLCLVSDSDGSTLPDSQ